MDEPAKSEELANGKSLRQRRKHRGPPVHMEKAQMESYMFECTWWLLHLWYMTTIRLYRRQAMAAAMALLCEPPSTVPTGYGFTIRVCCLYQAMICILLRAGVDHYLAEKMFYQGSKLKDY